ncbi:MAG: polysaccharide deacetylase family protein [Patescibacteria group bacterium]
MKKVIVTTSWDDGHVLDLKLAQLLKKYNLKGTFYIAPECHEILPQDRLSQVQVLALSKDFEIGAHTMTHPDMRLLTDEQIEREISDSKKLLEKWTGGSVKSFCYPSGKYLLKQKQVVREAGFVLARTVRRFSFGFIKDLYEMPTSIHTYDHWLDAWQIALFVRFNPFKFFQYYRHWDNLAIAMFERVSENGGVFHIWGHSWEIEKLKDWNRLERVFQHIANKAGVEYLTNGKLV